MKHAIVLYCSLAAMSLGACNDTLAYGERTGFNLSVRTDAPQGQPLEVNAGLQRRVVGHVPPSSEAGEAVNMVSAFNLEREGDAATPLANTLTIETSFASGAAAIKASENTGSVAEIFNLPGVDASPEPADVSATNKILDWLNEDQSRADEYVAFVKANGVQVADGAPAFPTAINMAVDANNAAVNLRFVSEKKL